MNFRLRDYLPYPLAIKRAHDRLDEFQYRSRDSRRAWVQEQLDRMLQYAIKTVPYYRRTLGPYQSRLTEMVDRLDLTELPSITKETVREHAGEFRAEPLPTGGVSIVRTSGTTGTPAEFLVDTASNVTQFASLWQVMNWAGYRFGNRFVDIRRNPTKAQVVRYDYRLNSLVLPVYHFKKENIPLYVERIRRFNPVLIKTYPSAIDLFCRWLRELGIDDFHPRAVLTCAETLLDHQRVVMEEVLRCPLFDFYNHNERAGLISTCEKGTYHVHEEYSYLELVTPADRPAGPGEIGEVVATTFNNQVMPLIRYRTGDLATVAPGDPCECGRTYGSVERINGRVTDVVVTPDGRHLGGLEHAFMRSPGVRLSQIVQDTVEEIQVNIVKAQTYTAADAERIEHGLRTFLGDGMRIKFNFVDNLPPGQNGKLQFVISKPGQAAREAPAGRR